MRWVVAIVLGLVGVAEAEPIRTVTLEAPEVEAVPAALGKRVVYLNFDGVSLVRSNTDDDAVAGVSAIVLAAPGEAVVIPRFQEAELREVAGLERVQIIQGVVDQLYRLHGDFDVELTTVRPENGPYSMVVIGGSCQSVFGEGGCGGVALLDCGDQMASNVTFVFPPRLRVGDLVTVAAQEAAHAFGLAHTLDTDDVMYPTVQGAFPSRFGAGPIPNGEANCQGGGFQSSDQRMLEIIGPRGEDVVAPAIQIVAPLPGSLLLPGDVVSAVVADSSEIEALELAVGGAVAAATLERPFRFTVPEGVASGEQLLEIRGRDIAGNEGAAVLDLTVAGPEHAPCADGACPDDAVCLRDLCVDRSGGGLGGRCADDDFCDSRLCGQQGGERRCAVTCTAVGPCPLGFECTGEGLCWPAATESGGCSCRAGGEGGTGAALIFLVAAVALRRRD
jgi:MYXO-CTERM domain-containing protein